MAQEKIMGNERRDLILKWLKEADEPITGNDLSHRTHVSRQVIVQDISLLKAKNEPIIATAQGYIYIKQNQIQTTSRVIVCKHTPEEMAKELYLIVDHGVTVKDVIIEHPIYGDLTANLRLNTRRDVDYFLSRMNETNASLLSSLTEGIHLHTLEATSEDKLDAVEKELEKEGFSVTQER